MKSMAFGSKLELQAGSWLEAVYDVVIGVVVGASHSLNMLRKNTMNSAFIGWIFEYLGFERHVGGKSTTNTEGLKVVAVGYGRTGTVRSTSFRSTAMAASHRFRGTRFRMTSGLIRPHSSTEMGQFQIHVRPISAFAQHGSDIATWWYLAQRYPSSMR